MKTLSKISFTGESIGSKFRCVIKTGISKIMSMVNVAKDIVSVRDIRDKVR